MKVRQPWNWRGYAFIAPAAVYLLCFSLLPILFALFMSLHDWNLVRPDRPYVGLDNFRTLFADPFFVNAIKNSCIYVAASVPLGVISSLVVALIVARPLRAVGVFRTLFYVPGICSQVAIAMVWIWILMPGEQGLINFCLARVNDALQTIHLSTLLASLGLGSGQMPIDTNFLKEPGWAMAALVAMSLWIGLGPRMIIFVAGLQNIPEELYEAASLDGCTGWKRFRYVTLPQLAPTTLFVTLTTSIAAFQLFTPVYVMTKGGPDRTTDVVLYHIFKELWWRHEAGMASAMSCVLLGMILAIAVVQLVIMRRGFVTEEAR